MKPMAAMGEPILIVADGMVLEEVVVVDEYLWNIKGLRLALVVLMYQVGLGPIMEEEALFMKIRAITSPAKIIVVVWSLTEMALAIL